jgi:hypothetical protein
MKIGGSVVEWHKLQFVGRQGCASLNSPAGSSSAERAVWRSPMSRDPNLGTSAKRWTRSASAAQLQESSFGPKVDDANSSAARPFAVSIIRCRPCSLAADESVIRAPVPVYSDWGRTFLKSCLRLWLRSGIDRQIRRRRYFRSCATPRDSAFAEARHNRKSPAIADGAFNRSDAAAYLRVAHIYMLISMPTDTSTTFGAFQAIWALP